MPVQGPQWMDFLSCQVCYKLFSEVTHCPISLGCGHTVCKMCLLRLQQSKCPFDQSIINCDISKLPVNYALLQLVGAAVPDKLIDEDDFIGDLSDAKKTECYESARKCIEEVAAYLKPLSEDSINELEKNSEDLSDLKISKMGSQSQIQTTEGRTVSTGNGHNSSCVLSRPMQRKLVMLINCQLVEEEGRSRAARAARSLGERTVTELILAHQNPQQLSANLWAAVRTRGCQFLGPGMQEEVLRLILLALEDGSALSRKVLVLFVVQRLEKQYPQASKTAIGHVVQLLYRASCFRVTKREEESSLMQLKEEFRTYEALRLEHDAQIVQIAMEAGLRISPEQWSSLLYGDTAHKSHMQSIIDKHQSPASFTQGISELVMALQKTGDPCNLLGLKPHLDFLAKIDPSPDCPAPSWEDLEAVMRSLKIIIQGLVDFVMRYNHRKPETAPQQNARYKTSMCRDFQAKSICPRGAACTFAHSQEELDKYRSRAKKLSHRSSGSVSAFASLTPKQKLELAQVQETSRQKMENTKSVSDGSSGPATSQLTAQMAGLSVSPGIPKSCMMPQTPGVGLSNVPGPRAVFPRMPSQPPINSPVIQSVSSMMETANRTEEMYTDQLPPYPQQIPMRMRGPSELGVPYHHSHMASHTLRCPNPPMLSPAVYRVGTPVLSGPGIKHPPPGTVQGPVSDMAFVPGPSATCPHMHMPGELMPQSGTVFTVGGAPSAVMVPVKEQMVIGPGEDLQGMATSGMQTVQTLEKLQNRKSEIISHLKIEGLGMAELPTLGSVSSLDSVLALGPRSRGSPMSNSVNDSFVATRTTNRLDDLDLDRYIPWSAGEVTQSWSSSPSTGSIPPFQHPVSSPVLEHSGSRVGQQMTNSKKRGTDRDLAEDGDSVLTYIETILDDDDDSFIPFDPPLVSKFGPISRNARVKGRNTAPVQVTAEENMKKCIPVLAVTPISRPYPTSAPVPSMYTPQVRMTTWTSSSVPPSQSSSIYSFWSGQDWLVRKIPEMVHELEKSAVQASTTSQRLALQLQAVELQISMKTGQNPKPVHQILKEAEQSKSEPGDWTSGSKGESRESRAPQQIAERDFIEWK